MNAIASPTPESSTSAPAADPIVPPISERLARTLALYDELRAIWGSVSVRLNLHGIDHADMHANGLAAVAILPPGGTWSLAAHADGTINGPGVFASVSNDCARCAAMVEVAKREADARAEVQP